MCILIQWKKISHKYRIGTSLCLTQVTSYCISIQPAGNVVFSDVNTTNRALLNLSQAIKIPRAERRRVKDRNGIESSHCLPTTSEWVCAQTTWLYITDRKSKEDSDGTCSDRTDNSDGDEMKVSWGQAVHIISTVKWIPSFANWEFLWSSCGWFTNDTHRLYFWDRCVS